MPDGTTRTHAQETLCEEHDLKNGPDGWCPRCAARLEQMIDEQDAAYERFLEYKGDAYLTEGWMADGLSLEDAKAQVQDPRSLCVALELGPLEMILSDRWATAALQNAITSNNKPALYWLSHATAKWAKYKPKKKPGPQPKSGKHMYDRVYDLFVGGVSIAAIIKELFPNAPKGQDTEKLIRAHLRAARKNRKK